MPGVAAAGEQRAVHAGGGAHVGGQHIAQVERLQVVEVEVVDQPGVGADHLVGAGDLFDGPFEERTDCVVVLAVGGLARQQRAVHRCVDDQPRSLVGGIAQHQGEEAGGEALAQGFQQAAPGCGFQRAAIDEGEQFAQLGGGDAGDGVEVVAGRHGVGHACLDHCCCEASIGRADDGVIVRSA
ncbi:hypothetical protein D3C80_1610910 [compost metagenome]